MVIGLATKKITEESAAINLQQILIVMNRIMKNTEFHLILF